MNIPDLYRLNAFQGILLFKIKKSGEHSILRGTFDRHKCKATSYICPYVLFSSVLCWSEWTGVGNDPKWKTPFK